MNVTRALGMAAIIAISLGACSTGDNASADEASSMDTPGTGPHTAEQEKNLATFDDLDFRVYSNQIWDDFSLSHADNIIVHYPDGSTTTGLAEHLVLLKPMLTYIPDAHIDEHPIRLADGKFTAVQGILKGTFTKPMDMGNGEVLQPTGNSIDLSMVTVARWENGRMAEEWLYWDNAAFMDQLTKE